MSGSRTRTATRTAGEVARLLGIAESTLRAWHRRYDVGPRPVRPGGYRRYSDEDIATLRRMHDLVAGGMLRSDAAEAVRTPEPLAQPDQLLPELLVASYELDSARCRGLLERAVRECGVRETWERVCRPALAAIDASQLAERRAGACVEREHVLSWAISATLHGIVPAPGVRSRVLLACAGAEQHTLALEVLAAALAERNVGVRMLGAAVPAASLRNAVAAATPDVVVVWAQRGATAGSDTLAAMRRLPVRRIAAGPGWSPDKLAGAELVTTLPDAVSLVLDAIGTARR
jgi:MerR family transcriptional regulator, light-induced transcriptional regulator